MYSLNFIEGNILKLLIIHSFSWIQLVYLNLKLNWSWIRSRRGRRCWRRQRKKNTRNLVVVVTLTVTPVTRLILVTRSRYRTFPTCMLQALQCPRNPPSAAELRLQSVGGSKILKVMNSPRRMSCTQGGQTVREERLLETAKGILEETRMQR